MDRKVRIRIGDREFQSLDEVPAELRPRLEKQLLEELEREMGLPDKASAPLGPERSRWAAPAVIAAIAAAAGWAAYAIFKR